jgi:hypothetical protein
MPEPEMVPGACWGIRTMADWPVRNDAQATSAAGGPTSPVPGLVGMVRVVLLLVGLSLHPLQTLL